MLTSITSSRHFKNFYLTIVGFVSFCLIMASIVGALHNQARSQFGEIVMLLMGLAMIFLAFFTILRYYKNAPLFVVDKDSIVFNNTETYFWKDLEKIEMTGKKRFNFIGADKKEAITLKFPGLTEKYIFDDMYANTPEIKAFIQWVVINKKPFEPPQLYGIDTRELTSQSFVFYKGYLCFCFEGFMFLGLELSSLFFIVKSILIPSVGALIGFSLLGMLWFLLLGRRLFYFGISESYFIVRRHCIPWFKKAYRLSDIKEIVFEDRPKMPTSLRIINNNFESKLCPAATLWSKSWLQLKADLEKKNIKVRNEAAFF